MSSYVNMGLVVLGGVATYLYFLSKRLVGPHLPHEVLSDDRLQQVSANGGKDSYKQIDMLQAIPPNATHEAYAVIGGSGFLGSYLVRLLLLRGETSIRIIDLHPPKPDLISSSAVTFVKADISSLESIRSALLAPFPSTGKPPTVIYHTAAIIRFWERASYCQHVTDRINISGTANIISVLKDMPEKPIFIYTSSADAIMPSPFLLRLSSGPLGDPKKTLVISDDDPSMDERLLYSGCYAKSKRNAEKLVVEADKEGIARAAILRPGRTIVGLHDRLLTITLVMPQVPVFDAGWCTSGISAWDVVACHLLLEDALRNRPQDVRGEKFLITGKHEVWSHAKVRNTLKKAATKSNVKLVPTSPLLLLVIAHVVEAFLFLRYYTLLALFLVRGSGSKPLLTPSWMGELIYLQPATLEYLTEVQLDDSRARKILGYKPLWSVEHCIQAVVDNYEATGDKTHGMELPPPL